MSKISTVIIAKNEADRIANTIASALLATSEVIVFDTGSTDETIAVSKAAGAVVIETDWQGYGSTKNEAVNMATNDWILSLDADEVLSSELQQSIKQLEVQKATVYFLDRMINFEGQWIRHSGWYPGWVPRLYHKSKADWNTAMVHEKLKYPPHYQKVKLNGLLHHFSFRSQDHFEEKTKEYALLAAKDWIATGSKPSLFKRWFGSKWKYFQMYYLYRGYKDGSAGRTIAQVLAKGVKMKLDFYQNLLNSDPKQ